MAMGTERSKQLHNFTMPCDLRWGNQRFLRCMKVDPDGGMPPFQRFTENNRGSSDRQREQRRRTTRDWDGELMLSEFVNGSETPAVTHNSEAEDAVAAVREKAMLDLQTAADKMKEAFATQAPIKTSRPPPPPSVDAEAHRPWNLRTRASVFHKPPVIAQASPSLAKSDAPPQPQMRSSSTARADPNQRPKFSIPLTKHQIEEDFFSMAGRRPPRRPKKRTRIIQRSLDDLFPGLWLTEITADKYKVSVAPP